MEFPRYMYHSEGDKSGRLFQTEGELTASGSGWQTTPFWVRDETNPETWRPVAPAKERKENNMLEDKKPELEYKKPEIAPTGKRRGRKPKR